MHVLVTRPEPDALKLKGLIEARGHEVTVVPLLSVDFERLEVEELEGITALIATSRNGLRAMVGTDALEVAKHLTVFAVGGATADEARRMGFVRIVKGPGSAAGLGPLIASMTDESEDVLLHLAGETVAVDLVGELEQMGFRASARRVYRMAAAEALPDAVCAAIRDGEIEGVALMSPQTAAIWSRLVQQHGLGDDVREVMHLCLSSAVAARLGKLGDIPIDVTEQPTLHDMLELIDSTAARYEL